jgi:hypothetical protein
LKTILKHIKMKKLLLGAAILLSTGLMAQAQNTTTSKDARIGVKAGVNLSRFSFSGDDLENNEGFQTLKDYQKDNIGFNVTVYGDFGIAKNLMLQPGISLQNKGSKFEANENGLNGSSKINLMYVDVPINAVYSIPTGDAGAVQISAGPYIGFAISGKQKSKAGDAAEESEDLKFGSKADDDLSSMDYGANFGLGYRMNNGFTLGANYGLGLGNLVTKDNREGNDAKITNRVLGFTVGYSF